MGNTICNKEGEEGEAGNNTSGNNNSSLIAGRFRVQDKIIGKGSFAVVKLGYDVKSKKKVAVRTMQTTGICPVSLEHLQREAQLHPTLDHPSIVKCMYCKEDENCITMVQEFVPDGSLLDYYAKKRVLMEFEVRSIFSQLISAVEYMHNSGIVHRDIKADNILIYAATQTIKLADMGFADRFKTNGEERLFRNFPGTLAYSPPEVLQGKPHRGVPRDVWSCGVLLYILPTGKYPFGSQATLKTKNRVISEEPDYSSPKISNVCRDIIQKMLDKDPEQRINIAAIKEHPWMTGGALMRNSIIRRASSALGDLLPSEKKELPTAPGQEEVLHSRQNTPRVTVAGDSMNDIPSVTSHNLASIGVAHSHECSHHSQQQQPAEEMQEDSQQPQAVDMEIDEPNKDKERIERIEPVRHINPAAATVTA